MTPAKTSSFSKSVGEKETKTLVDLSLTKNDIKSLLVTNGYINAELVNFMGKVRAGMNEFQYDNDSLQYLIQKLWEFTGYKIYLQSEHLYKATIKTYLDNVEANTWLKSKSEVAEDADKMKTDSFVKNETTIKLNNMNLIHSYIIDFNREIDTLCSNVDSIVSYMNVKIKYLKDEREMSRYQDSIKK